MKKIYSLWMAAVFAAVIADIVLITLLIQKMQEYLRPLQGRFPGSVNIQRAVIAGLVAALVAIVLAGKRHHRFQRTEIGNAEGQEPLHNHYIFRGNHE